MKRKVVPERFVEITTIIVFAVCLLAVGFFHEPWFDEAQAWQIAKCASLKEILFTIPHFEGHPPLWHLLLAIPAKAGISFEIGLKSIGFIISFISAFLIIFHSKFPRIVRLLLPFTYFFFYQYGIIVRPYGLMLMVFILIGMNLSERRIHPWRISLLLFALCLTSAYGILFAGGLALCMTLEILQEKGIRNTIKEVLSDSRTTSLLSLLAGAALLIMEIRPSPIAYGVNIEGETPLIVRLLCGFFTFPVECFLSTSSWFGIEQVSMKAMRIPLMNFLAFFVLGIILLFVLICIASRRTLKYLFVPYVMYVFFAASVYSSTHHIGIVFILIICWLEFNFREGNCIEIGRYIRNKISQSEKDKKLIHLAAYIVCCACIAVPLYWNASACIHDIQQEYCFARETAKFIKEHELQRLSILCQWTDSGSLSPQAEGHDDYINTYLIGTAVPINAYFENNIAFNLNGGRDNEGYIHHRIVDYEESRKMIEEWREVGAPDVIIGRPNLKYIYDDITYDDYSLVFKDEAGLLWKTGVSTGTTLVYIRNDLIKKYQLTPLDDSLYRWLIDGLQITEEMKKAVENGKTVEEVLDPYLDMMFGEN